MTLLGDLFELNRGGASANVRSMEGMRGFAVFLVFLVHFVTSILPWLPDGSFMHWLATAVHRVGNTGVDLFFVLSGYLIYGSLIARPQQFSKFIARRVERIYPTFLVVLSLYLLLSFLIPAKSKLPEDLVQGAIYVIQNLLLLPGIFSIEPIITVAWSLSYEMFYYLAIPALIAGLGLRRWRAGARFGAFAAAAVVMLLSALVIAGPIRLVMFISGILLYESQHSLKFLVPSSAMGFCVLAGSLFIAALPLPGALGQLLKISSLFVSFYIVCLASFRHPGGALARMFSWTPMRWLGNISYSYYLIHGLTLNAWFTLMTHFMPRSVPVLPFVFAQLVVSFALTVITSAILFLRVEKPYSLKA